MQTPGSSRKGGMISYTFLALAITFASSLITPVLSFYLDRELNFSTLQISSIFVILPISIMIVVQTFAKLSDGVITRPIIVCIATIFGAIAPLYLVTRPNFISFITIGILCLALYPMAYPQIFASAREYTTKYLNGSVMYTTFLRSLVSLSWVIGPPTAYYMVTTISFNSLFYFCASVYAIATILTFFYLPDFGFDKEKHQKTKQIKIYKNKDVILLFIAVSGFFTAFLSYIISMPLYITNELELGDKLPGYMMSVCAFIEIPLMFITARFVKRLGLKNLVFSGGISLAIFLGLMFTGKSFMAFIAFQFFAALFIALVSNLGMIFFQELLPEIPGQATSLYINACTMGQTTGGALIALASFGSYKYIFLAGLIIAALSSICVLFISNKHHYKA